MIEGTAALNPYDLVPYEGFPCPSSHPDGLGAIGQLWGLTPAPMAECRVLELGCGTGGNLIPMAAAFPRGRFKGIDLSQRQIEAGRKDAAELGLANLAFEVGDLTNLSAELGTFDFIIAHGVFSWVPAAAQQGLVRTVRTCLAEQGIAYVSYTVAPGSAARGALREMLRWAARGEEAPAARIGKARELASYLTAKLSARTPYAAAIRRLLGELGAMSDAYLLHDYLAETHEALTLTQFADRAGEHRLQYLGDAQLHTEFAEEPDAPPLVGGGGPRPSRIEREQLRDLLDGRSFRTSLLCRSEAVIQPELAWSRLTDLFLTTRAQPRGEEDGHWMFRASGGELFGTTSELVGSALTQLAESHPRPVGFRALCDLARSAIDGQPATPADLELLGVNLLAAAQSNQVSVGTCDRNIRSAADEPLIAVAGARAQAARGSSWATNLWHQRVELSLDSRQLLPLVDGTRARRELLVALPAVHPGATESWLDEQLSILAESALLTTP